MGFFKNVSNSTKSAARKTVHVTKRTGRAIANTPHTVARKVHEQQAVHAYKQKFRGHMIEEGEKVLVTREVAKERREAHS